MNNYVLDEKDIPQVAMDAMNDVHREELAIVNQLNQALISQDMEEISYLCQQWLDHTLAHFDKENSMMEQYNFPAYHCHHGEHQSALSELESTIKNWETDRDQEKLACYVRETWPQWYVNHISTMDVVTSVYIKQCIAGHGVI